MKKSDKQRKPSWLSKHSSDSKAAIFTLAFVYLFLIAEIVIKVKVNRDVCTFELLLLFLMFAVFGLFKKFFSNSAYPCGFDGMPLAIGETKEDKKKRNRYYIFSSLLFSGIFAIVVFFGVLFSADSLGLNIAIELFADTEKPNALIALILAVFFFIVSYPFAYMVNYVWYEHTIAYAREELNDYTDLQKEIEAIKLKEAQEPLVEEQTESSQETSPEVAAVKKRRGRPPKAKTEKEVSKQKKDTTTV